MYFDYLSGFDPGLLPRQRREERALCPIRPPSASIEIVTATSKQAQVARIASHDEIEPVGWGLLSSLLSRERYDAQYRACSFAA